MSGFLSERNPTLERGPGNKLYLKRQPDGKSHTLVLDMDRTILISILSQNGESLPNSERRPAWPPDRSIVADLGRTNGGTHKIEVWFRRGLLKFLETVSKHYEIVIFSAGLKHYVTNVIHKLVDPDNKYITEVFARDKLSLYNTKKKRNRTNGQDLWGMEGVARVKNISGFFAGKHPRRPETVVCVDDKVECFVKHLRNVVSVPPFLGEKHDRDLQELSTFLLELTSTTDVREEIAKRCDLLAHVGPLSRIHR